jgi:hypothetical protein
MSNTTKSLFVVAAVVGLAACAQLGTMATGSGLNAPGIPGASSDPAQGNPAAPSGGESKPGTTAADAKPEEKKEEPKAPTTVSVKIRSACSKTAKVFYGDKPGFSSGTGSSVSSNSVSNKTFAPGDMMWVTDDKNNGLASVKVEAATKEIEIGGDCTSIKAK